MRLVSKPAVRYVLKVARVVCRVTIGAAVGVWLLPRLGPAAGRGGNPHGVTTAAGLTVERVRALSELTTLRVEVADALVTELRGYTGGEKAVLVVKGDFALAADLSAARFEAVDEQTRTAVLVLPRPRVQSVRVDHERTRLLGVWASGLWAVTPGGGGADAAAVNRAYREAQRVVASAAEDPHLNERARRQAEQALGAFFAALGWRVTIRWA